MLCVICDITTAFLLTDPQDRVWGLVNCKKPSFLTRLKCDMANTLTHENEVSIKIFFLNSKMSQLMVGKLGTNKVEGAFFVYVSFSPSDFFA